MKEKISNYTISSDSDFQFPYSENTINFKWVSTKPVGSRAFFQYKLHGLDGSWSRWSSNTEASFLLLPSGNYTFMIRSIGVNGLLTKTKYYNH